MKFLVTRQSLVQREMVGVDVKDKILEAMSGDSELK